MATPDELLKKVKLSLSILDDSSDDVIRQKIAEAADYLKSQGVSAAQIGTDLGAAAITLYVNDFWSVGGKIEESPAFWNLVSRLYSNSRADDSEESKESENGNNNLGLIGKIEAAMEIANLALVTAQNNANRLAEIPTSNLLFMRREGADSVLTVDMPETQQILLPMQWFPAEPETWQEVLAITPAPAINSQYFEVIQGNRFSAKIFLNSDVARAAARVRLQLIDTSDNAVLATATQIVDFPGMNIINVPILFEGFYQAVRRIPLSRIRLVVSVMTSLFGFQIQIISNPPNEISFISKTSTTTITEEQIREIVYEAIKRTQEG